MWIGVGVYGLYEAFRSFGLKEFKRIGIVAGAGVLISLVDSSNTAMIWLVIAAVSAVLIAIMVLLRKLTNSESGGAIAAVLLTIAVPLLMAFEGWDDHDRSNKTTAHDLALNYLNSCAKNSILFTNGDNDTFPLWYMQEVEGKRTDVRVANLSLMQTDWYTDQMKMKAYDSDPLPIKFTEEQILMYAGNTDHVLFSDLFDLFYVNAKPEVIEGIIKLRVKSNRKEIEAATARLAGNAAKQLESVTSSDPRVSSRLAELKAVITGPMKPEIEKDVYLRFQSVMELMTAARGGMLTISNEAYQGLVEAVQNYEMEWNMTDLKDAMAFVRDDNNMVTFQGQRTLRVFPSSGFKLKVNKENAVRSGIIAEKDKANALDEIRFRFDKGGISREQVMMLDVLANNDWKRAIYFSSPGGSDVSMALLRGMTGRDGYIKQNGMAFELSPMPSDAGSVNRERMYEHLMKTYAYGKMDDPKVLTDYYARRHTAQYRSHFSRLAEDYLLEVVRAEQERERIKMMQEMGADEQSIPKPRYTDKDIADAKRKAISLLNKSLEVMPADVVIDYGEPQPNNDPRRDYEFNGSTLKSYTDGILHEYVQLYFQAGAKKEAVELGLIVAEQLESIMDYFEFSDVKVAANPANTPDLYAAIEAYFQMHITTLDPEFGDPKGKLAQRTEKRIKHLYEVMYPNMISELKKRAQENGESLRRSTKAGPYAKMLFQIEDYSQAMAINYGLIDAPTTPPAGSQGPQPSPAPTPGQGLPTPTPALPAPGFGEE
jgi:hypothetical protein